MRMKRSLPLARRHRQAPEVQAAERQAVKPRAFLLARPCKILWLLRFDQRPHAAPVLLISNNPHNTCLFHFPALCPEPGKFFFLEAVKQDFYHAGIHQGLDGF